jgi:hypothetical protein
MSVKILGLETLYIINYETQFPGFASLRLPAGVPFKRDTLQDSAREVSGSHPRVVQPGFPRFFQAIARINRLRQRTLPYISLLIYYSQIILYNAVGIATGWTKRDRSSSPGKVKNFLFSTSSRQVLGPTQPPIQWISGALSPKVKRSGREADHSPTSARVNKTWIYTSTPHYTFIII